MDSDSSYSYIEFTINSLKIFDNMTKLFEYIKIKKQDDNPDYDMGNDSKIMDFFEEKELNYFWWPTEQENKEFWNEYMKLPREDRDLYLEQSGNWDYETVFSEIDEGEYDIIGCKQIDENIGRLYYYPWAFPYGGAEPLIEALKAFGVEIVKVSDWG